MNGLGGLDRPGAPTSPGAWDERSEEWLTPDAYAGEDAAAGADVGVDAVAGMDVRAGGAAGVDVRTRAAAGTDVRTRAAAGTEAREGAAARTDVREGTADGPPLTAADARTATATPTRTTGTPTRTTGTRSTPTDPRTTSAGRMGADPVKALMYRHRGLCERAVDPLDIAAGLEAHGITDRTASRFLHRDVFSLAEEMYARVPRDAESRPGATALTTPRARADWILLALLPGAICAASVTALHLTHGQSRLIAAVAGTLAVALAVRAALARGPLAGKDRAHPTITRITWLLAYALLGDGLLQAAATGGPDALPTGTAEGPWPLTTAPVLALTLSCAPAAWCAHLFAVRARRKLSASRALEEFATSAKPLLLGTFALYLCALTALLTLTTTTLNEPPAYLQTLTLGALLLLARLLTTHGFTHAPALVLTAAASAEATALAALFAARLPGCALLATPVQTLIDTWGPAAIPTIACGAGALTLLLHTLRTVTRASAHARADDTC
ncbi:hypothetical protein OG331_18345 [Streptomyces sp. NBC_01017]|uniref:hypothetical protein n=1 Tax=Streptomyces sp. NBC_01017 TaxID=2903721 RepID=UPI00386F4EDA|nr:hypothetical protein OG331_18345 [Streptomyces sp. NBC_01017]